MNNNLTLTDKTVLEEAQSMLEHHLDLQAEGYKCTTEDLLNVLLGVAADQGTIESVCADLVGAPNPETIRQYMNEQLCVEELPQLEAALNRALVAKLPPRLWRRGQDVAMDFHDHPYYGKSSQEEGLWIRAQAKDGTTRLYRVATANILVNHLRFTLRIHFVLPGTSKVDVVCRLLRQVQELNIPLRRLLLDRGSAGIEVQEILDQQQILALIACPIRGKSGATRALCQGRSSYRTQHTFKGTNCQAGQRSWQCVEPSL